MSAQILVVDDEADAAVVLRDALRRRGYDADAATTVPAALAHARDHAVDVVVTSAAIEGISTGDLCNELRRTRPDVPVIFTGPGDVDAAVAAIRCGAYDFVARPITIDALLVAVARAVEHRRLLSEVQRLRSAADTQRIEPVIGESPAIREIKAIVEQVADSDATVLITGESGTGKERVARALHSVSHRRDAAFVAVDCAAMPATLLESELFGHVRGAFTDAKRTRPGLLMRAGHGTIFLDEIGDMPLEMQSKLLRALQERRFRPVGADTELPLDARLVTATNRDLDADVAVGRFREDLFYRINVVQIAMPPLRERRRDILLLAQYFLTRVANRIHKPVVGISTAAAQKLVEYEWPGNVRELENCIERAVTLTRLTEIGVDDLTERIRQHQSEPPTTADDQSELVTLAEMKRRYVRHVMAAVRGNKTRAARILGLDRRTLCKRLDDDHVDDEGADAGHNGHGGSGDDRHA